MELYRGDKAKPEEEIDSPEEGLLPVSMFPDDVKPGYKCTIEVVGVSGDEVRVIKKHEKDDKDEKEKESDSEDSDEDGEEDPFSEDNLKNVRERVGENY